MDNGKKSKTVQRGTIDRTWILASDLIFGIILCVVRFLVLISCIYGYMRNGFMKR